MIFNRDRRALDGLGIERGVVAMSHGDFGEGPGGASGVAQIAHRRHAETLRRRGPSPTHVELIVTFGGSGSGGSTGALPAHAAAGAAIHRAESDDSFAVAGFEQTDGVSDERLGAGAAT